jgi:hypothetical protein
MSVHREKNNKRWVYRAHFEPPVYFRPSSINLHRHFFLKHAKRAARSRPSAPPATNNAVISVHTQRTARGRAANGDARKKAQNVRSSRAGTMVRLQDSQAGQAIPSVIPTPPTINLPVPKHSWEYERTDQPLVPSRAKPGRSRSSPRKKQVVNVAQGGYSEQLRLQQQQRLANAKKLLSNGAPMSVNGRLSAGNVHFEAPILPNRQSQR